MQGTRFQQLLGRGLSAVALATAAASALAAEEKQQGWSGEGELGYVAARGNTDTETISANLKGSYERDAWHHQLGVSTLQSTAEDVLTGEQVQTADRIQFSGQSNYAMSERSYALATFRYEEDDFSGYENQGVVSVGYGYHFIATETQRLDAEIGVGARRSTIADTGEEINETVLRFNGAYDWQITGNSKWTNNLLIESGEENTWSEFVTGLKVDMNQSLALKVSWTIRQNSTVPPGLENTDTITTINLVMGF